MLSHVNSKPSWDVELSDLNQKYSMLFVDMMLPSLGKWWPQNRPII